MIHVPAISITPDPKQGYRLKTQLVVELPRAQVFEFFADALNLERITPPWLRFSVLTPRPLQMHAGALLDYRLKIHGIPLGWRTEISSWEPPFRFVDQQIRGPYKRWHHEHTFEEQDGRTVVNDEVHYVPRGGRLIHKYFVRPDLEKIFRFRQDRLTQIFDENRSI